MPKRVQEVKAKSVEELDALLAEEFSFDNFAWQRDNKVSIDVPFRADGLHRILYKCPHCGADAEDFYKNRLGQIVGCEHCLTITKYYEIEMEDDNDAY